MRLKKMMKSSAKRIIKKAANDVLGSIGMKQEGRTRTWLDDNGWWLAVVDFQPSRWTNGTYLNTGVCFQWYPKSYLSFDVGDREPGFAEYVSDEQFTPLVYEYAESARVNVLEFREKFRTAASTHEYMTNELSNTHPVWDGFHLAMASLIISDVESAISHLDEILAVTVVTPAINELKKFCVDLLAILEGGRNYQQYLNEVILRSRQLKKLEHDADAHFGFA